MVFGAIAGGVSGIASLVGMGIAVHKAKKAPQAPGASGASLATQSMGLISLEQLMTSQGLNPATVQSLNQAASKAADKEVEQINAMGLFSGMDSLALERVTQDILANTQSVSELVGGKIIQGDIQADAARGAQRVQATNVAGNVAAGITQQNLQAQAYNAAQEEKIGTAIAGGIAGTSKGLGAIGEYIDGLPVESEDVEKYLEEGYSDDGVPNYENIGTEANPTYSNIKASEDVEKYLDGYGSEYSASEAIDDFLKGRGY